MSKSHRILVADDSLANRRLLVGSLVKAGYEMIEAEDGLAAVALTREAHPDLILLDVGMEGMDGFEVCSSLKAQADTSAIPIIFITARSGVDDIERAFAAGGADYVTKPFHMSEVKSRVAVHLGLREASLELEQTNSQLLQAQKLESIGQLAAGIAHEINTPTQYVGDNTRFLRDAFADIAPLLLQARTLARSVLEADGSNQFAAELATALDAADVEYLSDEIPRAIAQSMEGIGRVSGIVSAMKEFSHPGQKEKTTVDLNRAISSTVTVASNEWKYVAEMETDLDQDLPAVYCHPGEINQVVLNMVVNAAHAIADVVGDGAGGKGKITIRTRRDGDTVEIHISDTGTGIPREVRERIFDPFFTTKGVGKGTGQGLAIAHNVIVQKHRGSIEVQSEPGHGATFVLRIPLGTTAEPRGAPA